jgi:hypothetical protein
VRMGTRGLAQDRQFLSIRRRGRALHARFMTAACRQKQAAPRGGGAVKTSQARVSNLVPAPQAPAVRDSRNSLRSLFHNVMLALWSRASQSHALTPMAQTA